MNSSYSNFWSFHLNVTKTKQNKIKPVSIQQLYGETVNFNNTVVLIDPRIMILALDFRKGNYSFNTGVTIWITE